MREHSSHDNSTLKLLQMSDSFPLVCSNLKKKKLSNKIEKIQITPTQLRRISRMRTVDECENEDTPLLDSAQQQCAHSPSFVLILALIDSAGGSSFSLICPHSFDPPAESMRERMRTNEGE